VAGTGRCVGPALWRGRLLKVDRAFGSDNGRVIMPRFKKNPKCHVVSIRVSAAEKTVLEELVRGSSMSISHLMREALQRYLPRVEN